MSIEEILRLEQREKDKYKQYFELMGLWMKRQMQGVSVSDYILENGFENVGIYGKGLLGDVLFHELKECSRLEVKCFIDKGQISDGALPTVISPQQLSADSAPQLIIVTPFLEYATIREDLQKRCDAQIWSLEDVVYFCKKNV